MSAPDTNIDVARRCIDAISNRDAATLAELSTEDAVVTPLRAMVEDTVYRGHEGIDKWMRDVDETWAELRIEVEEISEPEPDFVVALVTLHGRGHGSNVPTQMRVELTARLRDGLVMEAGTRLASR
jgi:ketosteroid isomerase-like protein